MAKRTQKAQITESNSSNEIVVITPPNFQWAVFEIEGTAPYMQHNFGEKALKKMMGDQKKGTQSVKEAGGRRAKREPRDFDKDFEQAHHYSKEGWPGIPATAFKAAMVQACTLVGFKMTVAKIALHVEQDGFDRMSGQPLIKIFGMPERSTMVGRNTNGSADIRVRPRWDAWSATLKIRFDADLFSVSDVTNLLHRAGAQVNIGEGRNASKNSVGLGFGSFAIKEAKAS